MSILVVGLVRWDFKEAEGRWRDGEEIERVTRGLPSYRQTFQCSFLLHCWPAQHRSHVSILTHLVCQPLHQFHPRQVNTYVSYLWCIFFVCKEVWRLQSRSIKRTHDCIFNEGIFCNVVILGLRFYHFSEIILFKCKEDTSNLKRSIFILEIFMSCYV